MTVCANCGTPQGPFSRFTGYPLCKNLKGQIHKDKNCSCRISQCVERRKKIDWETYDKDRKNRDWFNAD